LNSAISELWSGEEHSCELHNGDLPRIEVNEGDPTDSPCLALPTGYNDPRATYFLDFLAGSIFLDFLAGSIFLDFLAGSITITVYFATPPPDFRHRFSIYPKFLVKYARDT
jgi:hypothetical protein